MKVFSARVWYWAFYREPISGFLLLVGLVDTALGGIGQHAGLLWLGLGTVFAAYLARSRYLQQVKRTPLREAPAPKRYLPPAESRSPLPTLDRRQQRSRP